MVVAHSWAAVIEFQVSQMFGGFLHMQEGRWILNIRKLWIGITSMQ